MLIQKISAITGCTHRLTAARLLTPLNLLAWAGRGSDTQGSSLRHYYYPLFFGRAASCLYFTDPENKTHKKNVLSEWVGESCWDADCRKWEMRDFGMIGATSVPQPDWKMVTYASPINVRLPKLYCPLNLHKTEVHFWCRHLGQHTQKHNNT